jgi:hypothetical protein
VVGINVLKIEPLPDAWVGGDGDGDGPPQPIADVKIIQQKLDERLVGGFGSFADVSLAAGAGSPTLVPMHHNLLCGMRFAADFLVSLQLGSPIWWPGCTPCIGWPSPGPGWTARPASYRWWLCRWESPPASAPCCSPATQSF